MTRVRTAIHTQSQHAVVERVSAILKPRDDVEALWLSGSLGRGEGDAFSDVDFLVLVVAAITAFSSIFLPRAKMLCTRTGAAWPKAFEAATIRFLAKAGVEV